MKYTKCNAWLEGKQRPVLGRTLLVLFALCATALAADPPDLQAKKLQGRIIALDAGHEQPYESPSCSRCQWLASGRSSFFYDIKLPYPDNPRSLTEGPYRGAIPEYRLNQDLALRLAAFLEGAGATVVLTRINRLYREGRPVNYRVSYHRGETTPIFLEPPELAQLVEKGKQRNPLNRIPIQQVYAATEDSTARRGRIASLENIVARAELANQANADMALVLHADAVTHADRRGRLLFVYHPGKPELHDRDYFDPVSSNSLVLAKQLNDELGKRPEPIPLDRIYGRDLWYLGIVQMPSVLIEIGRMTSKEDMDILANAENRQGMAEAIGRGIIGYFSK